MIYLGLFSTFLFQVFKDGSGFKAAWFSANVLSLKDGKACVSYNELTLGEGKLRCLLAVF